MKIFGIRLFEPEDELPPLTPFQQSVQDAAQSFADEKGVTLVTDQAQIRRDLETMAERGRKLREQK